MHDVATVNKLTYVNIDPGICDSHTDVIRHGHVNAEGSRVIEEMAKDELAI